MSYHWNRIDLTIKYTGNRIGTPTSKSCEPLIAEDDYTDDCRRSTAVEKNLSVLVQKLSFLP